MKKSDLIFTLGIIIGLTIGWFVDNHYYTKEENKIMQSLYNTDTQLGEAEEWIKYLEDDTKQGQRISYLEFQLAGCVSLKRDYDEWLKNQH